MTLSGAEIKRQILMSAGSSEIKRKLDANPPGISDGEYIEIGNELERVTKMPGWALIENFMIRRMNIVGLVFEDTEKNKDLKGIAKGYMELMQYIQLMIEKRDSILEKEKIKYETKNVPENKRE